MRNFPLFHPDDEAGAGGGTPADVTTDVVATAPPAEDLTPAEDQAQQAPSEGDPVEDDTSGAPTESEASADNSGGDGNGGEAEDTGDPVAADDSAGDPSEPAQEDAAA